jgi:hypothetical protein
MHLFVSYVVGIFPLFTLLGVLHWEYARNRRRFKTPLTSYLLRPPGESLRLRVETQDEEFFNRLLGLMGWAFGIGIGAWILFASPVVGGIVLMLGCAGFGVSARRFRSLIRLRSDCYLGFLGERAVGEELNTLLADGWKVFHDVEFDESPGSKPFNVDHVVVGAGGIFAIETKTRRKPVAQSGGESSGTVAFDGSALEFPWGRETFGIEDARRRADYLSRWLAKKLQVPCPVTAVLALPGWFVKRIKPSDLRVVSGREICQLFRRNSPAAVLDANMIGAVAALLDEKCRNVG